MKFTILLSSAILFATALTPISAYADDSNLKCRRMANGCDTLNAGGNERISISGFDIEVKSSDRGNRNTGNRNTAARTNDNIGNGNDDNVGADHADADDTDHANAGNDDNDDTGTDNTGNVDPGTDNNDTGGSNNPPPQSNSNDIKGFDPFGGLYGPGT
jgi:hypothetical protein